MVKRYSKLQPPIFEELEPRLLFSADIAEALVVDAVVQDFEEAVVIADLEPEVEPAAVIVVLPVEEEATVLAAQPTEPDVVAVDLPIEEEVSVPSDPVTTGGEEPALPTEETEADTGIELAPEDAFTDSAVTDIAIIESITSTEEEPAVAEPLDPSPVSASKELVLINDNVYDIEQLVADIEQSDEQQRTIEVVVLDDERSGIDQVSTILAEYNDLDAIHIITHGSDGAFALGSDWLDNDDLLTNIDAIAAWGNSLSEDADILLYGCNIAVDEDGEILTDTLAELTGADVAASDDMTGNAELGGDWELEYASGSIETSVAISEVAQADYESVLATYTVSNTNATGAGSLHQAILDANANSGITDTITFSIGSGPQTILVDAGGLPIITDSIVLDATTQPGYSGTPLITLDGSATPASSGINGITLRANDSTV